MDEDKRMAETEQKHFLSVVYTSRNIIFQLFHQLWISIEKLMFLYTKNESIGTKMAKTEHVFFNPSTCTSRNIITQLLLCQLRIDKVEKWPFLYFEYGHYWYKNGGNRKIKYFSSACTQQKYNIPIASPPTMNQSRKMSISPSKLREPLTQQFVLCVT